ncbi:hypothetical protein HDU83_009246 [Entophlyctis luteolus]|nr:hypothetical protein HDU83_009246 [Entophlyctis luteolus]KAJ3390572.1 hypothetical protein HDU84_007273 [Entophlyctis sp. JEL0112]
MQVIEPESSHFVSGIYCGPSIECDNRDNESAAKLFKQFSPPVTTSNSRTQSRRPSKENELWMIGGGDAYLSRASSLLSAHQKPRSAAATPPAASRASSFFSINSLGNSGNSGSMTNNRFSSPPPSKNNDVHASLSRRELLKTSVTNSPTRSSNLKSFLAKISNSLASIPRPKAPKPECMSSRSLQQENSPNARLDRNLSGGNVSDNQAAPDTIAIMMAMKELIESLSKFRTEQYELTRTVQYERECRIKLEKDVAAISEKLKTLVSNSEHVATLSLPQRES